MKESDIYSIGEAAAISALQSSTLRYYDQIGLVRPKKRGDSNNYRYYTRNQVVTLSIIRRLREMGCSLPTIQGVVESNSIELLKQVVKDSADALSKKIMELQQILEVNQDYIERLNQAEEYLSVSDDSISNVQIEEIPVTKLFANRQLMENYNNEETSISFWQNTVSLCRMNGISTYKTFFVTYYTPPLGQFTMGDCEVQLGVKVPDSIDNPNVVSFGGFSGATMIHCGPYSRMMDTHLFLLKWINNHGYTVCGPVSEELLLSPIDTKDIQVVKVIIPIKKKNCKSNRSQI